MTAPEPGAPRVRVLLRHFEPEDAAAVVSLWNTAYPDRRLSVEQWQREDQRFDASRFPRRRWVAIGAGSREAIGYGCVWNTLAARKYRLDLLVRPDWRRRGIGRRLLAQLIAEVQALAGVSLQARARADESDALAFLQQQGFVEVHRMVHVCLDLAEVDLSVFQPLVERVLASGVSISTLADEQARDPHCWHKFHALNDAARLGWPDPDPDPEPRPPVPQPYHEFKQNFREWNAIPEALFVACSQDQYLGYSGLAPDPNDPQSLYPVNTAVRPEARGQGIATALKVRTVEFAKQHGYAAIQTSSANPVMLAVNEKLGFRRVWSEVRLVRRLQPASLLAGRERPGGGPTR